MNKTFSVLDFGAVSNSNELQTKAFQSALDAVFLSGGGTLIIPNGEYRIGGLRVFSNTTVLLKSGAKLICSRNPEDYCVLNTGAVPFPKEHMTDAVYEPGRDGIVRDFTFLKAGGRWNNAIFRIDFSENVNIIGEKGSVIDGCDPYDAIGEEGYRGPHGITASYSKNLYFSGYEIINTGNWSHNIRFSENVTVDNITVKGGHDGVHFTTATNVKVVNSEFYTGDDCIAGLGVLNAYVSNCVLNTACSAFRFGGTNLYAEKCNIFGPAKYFFRGSLSKEDKINGNTAKVGRTNMLSVFTYYADKSAPIPYTQGNIQIVDCKVLNADRFLHYNFSGNEQWQLGSPLKSIRFENIEASGVSMPITAYGDKDLKVTLELKDVSIEFTQNHLPLIQCANYDKIILDNVVVKGKVSSLLKSYGGDGRFFADKVVADYNDKEIELATDKFVCNPI